MRAPLKRTRAAIARGGGGEGTPVDINNGGKNEENTSTIGGGGGQRIVTEAEAKGGLPHVSARRGGEIAVLGGLGAAAARQRPPQCKNSFSCF
jgi:hypothetical protein